MPTPGPRDLLDVTVVADTGMMGEANQKRIEAAGLPFILGMKIPQVPDVVAPWRREHPGEQVSLTRRRMGGPSPLGGGILLGDAARRE